MQRSSVNFSKVSPTPSQSQSAGVSRSGISSSSANQQIATSRLPMNTNNTEFSFRRLNTIEEVTEPGTSALHSVYNNSQLMATRGTQRSSVNKSNAPFFKKVSNQFLKGNETKPIKTITVSPPPKGFQPPPLRPISQKIQQYPTSSSSYDETTWEKLKRWWEDCSCCRRQEQRMSGAW